MVDMIVAAVGGHVRARPSVSSGWPSSPKPTTCASPDHHDDPGAAAARRHRPRLRPAGHGQRRQALLGDVDLLRRRLRDRGGRGWSGPAHRVERVQRPEPRARAQRLLRHRPCSTPGTSTSPSRMAALGFEYYSSGASPCWPRLKGRCDARARSPAGPASRLPPLRAVSARRGHEVVCMDNLITGSPDNIEHLIGDRALPLHQARRHQVHPRRRAARLRPALRLARPARSTTSSCPIQTLKVGSLGTHKALGLAKDEEGALPAGLHLRSLRRPARASADARTTGATSTRSARAASTTRPSASPRP